jgi:hypothetical protein
MFLSCLIKKKNWLNQKIVDGHYKQSWVVSKYYSIIKQLRWFISKYTTSVKKGLLALKFKAGRPSFITQESKEEILNFSAVRKMQQANQRV